MKKILIIRLSSIGDIVLTTPIVRCLKQQRQDVELHYLTKPNNKQLLDNNPYINKIHVLQDSLQDTIDELRKEKFHFIVDLHKNLRSLRIKRALKVPSKSFPKLNLRKWWYVHIKQSSCMPNISIVDRYFEAVRILGITNDKKGLDFFLKEEDFEIKTALQNIPFIALVCGGQHATKQIPIDKIDFLCKNIECKVVLLGDATDGKKVAEITEKYPENVMNACGKLTLNQSALMLKNAEWVITADTGLMHIAAALDKRIISVWGNTVPEFGMYPYFKQGEESKSYIFEVKNLSCRPCSKIGFDKCPKKHFKCMNDIDYNNIITLINGDLG